MEAKNTQRTKIEQAQNVHIVERVSKERAMGARIGCDGCYAKSSRVVSSYSTIVSESGNHAAKTGNIFRRSL